MIKNCKSTLKLIPGSLKVMQWGAGMLLLIRRTYKRVRIRRCNNPEELFTFYFKHNVWANPESVSGDGSTVEHTTELRRDLERTISDLNIKTIVDAPCGDYNWFRLVRRGADVVYLGGDIVEPLIAQNKERFSDNSTSFSHLDITSDPLPEADIWLCRDCLIHFSNNDINKVIVRFRESKIRYFMTTIHSEGQMHADIKTGEFRLLDLRRPPFNFPEPILFIDDNIPGQPPRMLGLWDRASLTGNSN